jgi:hypothetical protein
MIRGNLGMRPAVASAIIAVAWAWATLGSGGSDVLSTTEFLLIDLAAFAALSWRGSRWQRALAQGRRRMGLVGRAVLEGSIGGGILGALVYGLGLARSEASSPSTLGQSSSSPGSSSACWPPFSSASPASSGECAPTARS